MLFSCVRFRVYVLSFSCFRDCFLFRSLPFNICLFRFWLSLLFSSVFLYWFRFCSRVCVRLFSLLYSCFVLAVVFLLVFLVVLVLVFVVVLAFVVRFALVVDVVCLPFWFRFFGFVFVLFVLSSL